MTHGLGPPDLPPPKKKKKKQKTTNTSHEKWCLEDDSIPFKMVFGEMCFWWDGYPSF